MALSFPVESCRHPVFILLKKNSTFNNSKGFEKFPSPTQFQWFLPVEELDLRNGEIGPWWALCTAPSLQEDSRSPPGRALPH